MKRTETLMLENLLEEETTRKRIYGCEEITIGFYNGGMGNEIVDFMTMDSKGIIKCYELKVTFQDLKSSAKKSFYGHFNYLVTTQELYDKVKSWDDYIPNYVGIIVGSSTGLYSKKKAKRQDVSIETETMLKESMVRSMFWKMKKYKDAKNLDIQRKLKSEIRRKDKEIEATRERALKAERIISNYETYKYYNDGIDIDLEAEAKKEKEKFLNNRRKGKM